MPFSHVLTRGPGKQQPASQEHLNGSENLIGDGMGAPILSKRLELSTSHVNESEQVESGLCSLNLRDDIRLPARLRYSNSFQGLPTCTGSMSILPGANTGSLSLLTGYESNSKQPVLRYGDR